MAQKEVQLSVSDIELLQMRADGMTHREIAIARHINKTSVSSLLNGIAGKMGVSGAEAAVAKARELNLVR